MVTFMREKIYTLHNVLITQLFFILLISSIAGLYIVVKNNNSQEKSSPEQSRILKVYIIDVGQGDSILIQTPLGKNILIDTGPRSANIDSKIKEITGNTKTIDVVLLTHPDADHIGGILEIIKEYTIVTLVEPFSISSSNLFRSFHDSIKENTSRIIGYEDIVVSIEEDIILFILSPPKAVKTKETNNMSLVSILTYKDTCFFFTGDADSEIESYIISRYKRDFLDCQVLKAGHHGSDSSTSDAFLEVVNPFWTVLSYGKDNPYGHPTTRVLNSIKKSGSKILKTPEMGTILFMSDGKRITLN